MKQASFNINSERLWQAKQPSEDQRGGKYQLSYFCLRKNSVWVAKKPEKKIYFSLFLTYTRESGKETKRGVGVTGRKRGRAALFCQRTESQKGRGGLPLYSAPSFKSHRQLGCSTKTLEWHHPPPPSSRSSPFTPPHLSSEPGTVHFLAGPMPASPPGNVFPALVVVGHIVTLLAVWRWRVCKKQGKTSWRTRRWQGYFRRGGHGTWRGGCLVVSNRPSCLLNLLSCPEWFFASTLLVLLPPLFFPSQFPVLALNPITACCSVLPKPKAVRLWTFPLNPLSSMSGMETHIEQMI